MPSATADMVHFDVMDGAFVPNISYGMPICKAVNQYTDMFLDTHLMIEKPARYIEDFAKAGARPDQRPPGSRWPPWHRGRPERDGALRREESGRSASHHQS